MDVEKSPSPDSGISGADAMDEDSPLRSTNRRTLRRISSHSSLDEEPTPTRRSSRSRSSTASVDDDAIFDDEDEDDASPPPRRRRRGRSSTGAASPAAKRNRVASDSGSDFEDELICITKAKSSKDQLAKIRNKRKRQRSDSEDSAGEDHGFTAKEEDFVEDEPPSPTLATAGLRKPPKYLKPTRAQLKHKCLAFFNSGLEDEMVRVPRINAKSFLIIAAERPFRSYEDLVERMEDTRGLSGSMVRAYLESLSAESELERVLADCAHETFELSQAVEYLKTQHEGRDARTRIAPTVLTNPDLSLKSYQVLGVRWLHVMSGQRLNAILADEMGLGKTVQIVAFLALLKERRKATAPNALHLIVVPSSTIDNWFTELHRWWPDVGVLNYYGGQEDRSFIRQDVLRRIRKARPGPAEDVEDEDRPLDVLLTTYTMITSKAEDRNFLKRINIAYAIFDEAHMLKNCKTKRYKELCRIRAQRKILLTGTPLQNNLVELMSLMNFVMPSLFKGEDQTTGIFDMFKTKMGTAYEADKIRQAKTMLRPFVLRRLKSQVLTQLPSKREEVLRCPMTPFQKDVYRAQVDFHRRKDQEGSEKMKLGVMVQLRKAANHPLLHRHHYDDERLGAMAAVLVKEEDSLRASLPHLVKEDLAVMSDFEIHKDICATYKSMADFALPRELLFESGKMKQLDKLLPVYKTEGKKVLLFSQFVIVLNILEDYLKARGISFLRLDGSTPVVERQSLIDDFNHEPELSVFLLSTRAGGLGINLVSASVIVLHDLDYNPYNDRQAEDRAHRMGQTRNVEVVKLVSEDTIEERIFALAQSKLHLEKQVTGDEDVIVNEKELQKQSMEAMLKEALGF